jgi:hypothetical protein
MNATWLHFGVSASRALYMFNPEPGVVSPVTGSTTVNNGSVYGNWSVLSGNASVFDSNLSKGLNFGIGAHLGWVSVQASDYSSKSTTGKQKGQLVSITERVGLHLTVTEYASFSHGQFNYNFGGSYSNNRISASLGYSIMYFPMLQQPFQKVLTVNIGLRFRSAMVSAQTIALPNGKVQWATSGGDYISTPLKMPAIPGATAADIRSLASSGHGGKCVVQVTVKDDRGEPVEGAAVLIGKDTLWSDSQGFASVREKRAANPVKVDLDQFIGNRNWDVVSAPTESNGGKVQIVLHRRG